MTIGEFLKLAREIKGLTLREAEAKTNISNAYISQVETGSIKEPSFKNVYLLCELYGIKIETLVNYVYKTKPDLSDTPDHAALNT